MPKLQLKANISFQMELPRDADAKMGQILFKFLFQTIDV